MNTERQRAAAFQPGVQRQFDLALHHHQAGRLSEAEPLYRQVLAAGPDHADSLHLLGLLLHQTRRGGEGAEMIGRACALDPTNPTYLQNLGVVLRQSGRLAEAEVAYRALLALQPDSAVAHGYLANALRDQGKLKAAVDSYQRALQLAPDDAAAHHNLGVAQVRMGQLDAAIASYRRSLALRPDNAEALNDLGVAFSKNGARDAAIEQFRRAIAVRPDLAEAHAHLGALLVEAGASEAALPHYQQALALKPAYGEAAVGLSIVLCKLRRLTEALATCDQALARGEDDARLHHNRGVALRGLGRPKEALAAFDRVPIGDPESALTLANRGHVLVEQRRFAEALETYDRALELGPGDAQLHLNRAAVLRDLDRFEEAITACDRAIALDPQSGEPFASRGHIQVWLKRFTEALASYDRALQLNPHEALVLGARLDCQLQLCRWHELERDIALVADELKASHNPIAPFLLLLTSDDPALQRMAAARHAQEYVQKITPTEWTPRSNETGKIRLGYFSPDFREHPLTKWILRLFESHDRERFEVIAFSLTDAKADPDRERIRRAVDQFVDVSMLSSDEIVLEARRQGIDIAIDLAGYTLQARPEVFAARCAPVQVSHIGYAGTMGADFIDYLIADHTVVDPSNQEHFTEKIVFMPDTYGVNSYRSYQFERPEAATMRSMCDLPADAFVFCCFNNTNKILPKTFSSWVRILKATPGSVLWLLQSRDETIGNLKREAASRGVDPARLYFADSQPFQKHMTRYRAADLFLDTLPYNAHTTAADALWMGLPVLTWSGRSFASRVAASFLKALGMPELVTHSAAEYEALAIRLAADPVLLSDVRAKLERQRLTAPLFDTALYARHLETAFETMMQRSRAGLAPDHIHVAP